MDHLSPHGRGCSRSRNRARPTRRTPVRHTRPARSRSGKPRRFRRMVCPARDGADRRRCARPPYAAALPRCSRRPGQSAAGRPRTRLGTRPRSGVGANATRGFQENRSPLSRLVNPYVAEFIGTTLLVLFGNGVVANVVLARTKGNNGGWIVITAGWGLAVFIGAFCSASYSGAHLNPAVTVAMAIAGKLELSMVAGYLGAQMAGGILGGAWAYFFYREPFKAWEDAGGKLGCFCCGSAIR